MTTIYSKFVLCRPIVFQFTFLVHLNVLQIKSNQITDTKLVAISQSHTFIFQFIGRANICPIKPNKGKRKRKKERNWKENEEKIVHKKFQNNQPNKQCLKLSQVSLPELSRHCLVLILVLVLVLVVIISGTLLLNFNTSWHSLQITAWNFLARHCKAVSWHRKLRHGNKVYLLPFTFPFILNCPHVPKRKVEVQLSKPFTWSSPLRLSPGANWCSALTVSFVVV